MKVLAVGCHPDDLEIACGGTLRKYTEQGAEVYMCHVANGNQGHVVIEPDPLREIRTLEAERSGAILGAKEVINLDVNDMEINSHDFKVMDAMADVVRKVRPDVIITHNDDDYMLDHKETSIIATNGSFCSGWQSIDGQLHYFDATSGKLVLTQNQSGNPFDFVVHDKNLASSLLDPILGLLSPVPGN